MIRHVAPTLEAARAVIAGDVGLIVVDGDRIPCLGPACGPPYGYCSNDTFAAPASFVRAVESGERIEIAGPCATCGGSGGWHGSGTWLSCSDCTAGLVVVGSVQATAVLPVVEEPPNGPYSGAITIGLDGTGWHFDRIVDLSVYGPPASLIGRFVIAVTDPRRTK